jgi:hypothetical protein
VDFSSFRAIQRFLKSGLKLRISLNFFAYFLFFKKRKYVAEGSGVAGKCEFEQVQVQEQVWKNNFSPQLELSNFLLYAFLLSTFTFLLHLHQLLN